MKQKVKMTQTTLFGESKHNLDVKGEIEKLKEAIDYSKFALYESSWTEGQLFEWWCRTMGGCVEDKSLRDTIKDTIEYWKEELTYQKSSIVNQEWSL